MYSRRAPDFWVGVTEAVRELRRARLEAVGESPRRRGRAGGHAQGPGDPTAGAALAILGARERLARLEPVVAGGRVAAARIRMQDAAAGDMVALVHIGPSGGAPMGEREAGRALGLPHSTAHDALMRAYDLTDDNGTARLLGR